MTYKDGIMDVLAILCVLSAIAAAIIARLDTPETMFWGVANIVVALLLMYLMGRRHARK